MMYDEADEEEGATDQAIADLTMFQDIYLSSKSPGHQAYLTYEGRPVIFIFPKGGYTELGPCSCSVEQMESSTLAHL